MSRCLSNGSLSLRASFDEETSEESIIQLVLSPMRRFTMMMQKRLA